jgi:hypothetical protein
MSALGHKRTLKRLQPMSALPPKAGIAGCNRHVRFVPKADSCTAAINAALLGQVLSNSPGAISALKRSVQELQRGCLYIVHCADDLDRAISFQVG